MILRSADLGLSGSSLGGFAVEFQSGIIAVAVATGHHFEGLIVYHYVLKTELPNRVGCSLDLAYL